VPSTRMRVAAVALGLGLVASTLTACGAGVRPTTTTGAVGTSIPAAGSGSSGAAAPAASSAARKQYSSPPPMTIDANKTYIATIKTSQGDIKVQLDPKIAPMTVNNFVFLARDHFYDGVIFHRVIKNFMIQGGDPLGSGLGGPGYKFNDEPVKGSYEIGSIAMANTAAGNNNGSQFFICEGAQCTSLGPQYNLFGKTIEGIEVVHKIANVQTGANDKPVQQVTISTVEISEQ
jgi:cyclophilin family peptidyl-prolyl cis-trans isomerase